MQTTDGVDFLGKNILAISAIVLVMFVYVIFLIRKRWRRNFLHDNEKIP